VAKYELLVDGDRRWRAKSEDEVRAWIRDYREEHAEDDPDATHVLVRRLSPWSWLTGGTLVDRDTFLA
jgi:phenylpyruvate tautomerase PptA (4-oxalocrotonate tautomerase family)